MLRLAALALCLAAPNTASAQPSIAWPAVTRDAKPWTRWWWMGSAVDSAGLTHGLAELAAAGFGGVEVTAIYGARGADSAYVPYLSDRWVALLRHTAAEAHRLGMAVDVPPGSGWRSGGPSVTEADANAALRITVDTVREGVWQRDLAGRRIDAVVAVSDAGETVEIPHVSPAGPLRWQAPAGAWTVYVAETRFSGDDVKRPAPGGEGRAIDPFSRAATARYLTMFGGRLASLPKGAIRAYFHDSFEYGGNGSAELFDAFRSARGYDLARELPALVGRGDGDRVARVKSDYRQTIDEMLLDRFARPFAAWSHARGSLFRLQAHGSPGNLLDLYAASDVPETEIFGPLGSPDADPLVNKLASSAAHVAGRPLASAESFTWLGEHFQGTLSDVKQAADLMFLAGINHLVYHGTAYSPAGAAWPGWEFYASSELNPRNAIWRDLPAFNRYVTRVQSVLQAGIPDDDVLLYWPVWDSWHDAAGMRMDFRVHAPAWLNAKPFGAAATALWNGGVGFDYVSDRLLLSHVTFTAGRLHAGGADYGAIVVPHAEHMPPATMTRLLALARSGATVVFVGGLPGDVPGLARLDTRRAELGSLTRSVPLGSSDAAGVRRAQLGRGRVLVGDRLDSLLASAAVRREPLTEHAGVRLIRRRFGDGRAYFVSHTGAEPLDGWVTLGGRPSAVAILDPMTGRMGLAGRRVGSEGKTEVYLQLAPGESTILRAYDHAVVAPRWTYHHVAGAAVALRGAWSVDFVDGGPVLPASFHSDSLVPWTGRGDVDADRFAGTARYVLRFDAPDAGTDHLLDLGHAAESARVRLNGRDLGVLFARPSRVTTGPLRRTGNLLEIEVTNVSANRVRDLDRRGVPWKIFRDINYVGLDYKPFDASGWPVRASGLIGPVTLTPISTEMPR